MLKHTVLGFDSESAWVVLQAEDNQSFSVRVSSDILKTVVLGEALEIPDDWSEAKLRGFLEWRF
jgi:hypothetical protein